MAKYIIYSDEFGTYEIDRTVPVFDSDGPSEKVYRYINFPGWIRSFSQGEGRPVYDDIYVASGPNAFARVEITDHIEYKKSRNFSIQLPINWTNNMIELKIVSSAIVDPDKAAIHIFNSSGERSNRGTYLLANPPSPPEIVISE